MRTAGAHERSTVSTKRLGWGEVLAVNAIVTLVGLPAMAVAFTIWWGMGLNPKSEAPSYVFWLVYATWPWVLVRWRRNRRSLIIVAAVAAVANMVLISATLAGVIHPPS